MSAEKKNDLHHREIFFIIIMVVWKAKKLRSVLKAIHRRFRSRDVITYCDDKIV